MTRNAFWGLCIGLCLAGTQAIAQKDGKQKYQND